MAPCELERRETVGDISISMYSIWQNCGGGYDVVTRAGGAEVARHYATYYPAAQARYNAEVRRRKAEQAEALASTMLGLYDEPCSCYDLPDGRAHVCAPCRRRAANTDILF